MSDLYKRYLSTCGTVWVLESEYEKLEQQLKETQEKLEIAVDALEFYGNKDSWSRSNKTSFCRITINDIETFNSPYKRLGYNYDRQDIGGKTARETLIKLKKAVGSCL